MVQIETQADVNDFIPAGSYLLDFFDMQDSYFTDVGDLVGIYFHEGVEYEKPEMWPHLRDVMAKAKAATCVRRLDHLFPVHVPFCFLRLPVTITVTRTTCVPKIHLWLLF